MTDTRVRRDMSPNGDGKVRSVRDSRLQRRLSLTMSLSMGLAVMAALLALGLIGALRAPSAVAQGHSHTDLRCPSMQEAGSALARASGLLEQARNAEAAEKLQPVVSLNCDARFSLLLAAAFDGLGNPIKAQEILQRAQSVWPRNNSIAASLAREYMTSGQVDKAVEALAHFQPTAATPAQEMEAATVIFLAGHQLASAAAVAKVAYAADPSIHSILLLANTLQLEGRYKDVIALLQDKRATYAMSAAFFVTLAESEYDADMLGPARRDLEGAIQLDPTLYQAQYLLGNVLMKQGDVDRASSAYQMAISLAPGQPRSYYQLALALRAKQDEAGEENLLLRALAIDSHYAAAHAELGRILLNQNRVPEAVTQLNLAIENNRALEQPYNLLARAYNRLGDVEKADEMAKRLATVRSYNHAGVQPGSAGPADRTKSP